MNDREFNQLIKKFFSSALNEQERQRLFDEYARREKADSTWDHQRMGDPEKTSLKILRKINSRISTGARGRRTRSIFYKVAAAVVLICGLGVYLFLKNQPTPSPVVVKTKDVIVPGGNKAILVTGDGRTISLNTLPEGAILDEARAAIKKVSGSQVAYEGRAKGAGEGLEYHTIRTPKGGQFQVVLSDGTKVWLNAWSSLSFPVEFSSKERTVELQGEAYFEVAKSETPFYVKTEQQTVRVLGTHFNVQSYEDDRASKVTLVEGSVYVKPRLEGGENSGQVLTPGQQAYITDNMQVMSVDVNEVLAWKDGFFQFTKTDLKSVMRQLARWYNIEVQYQGFRPGNRTFSGRIRRDVDLSDVLDMLGYFDVRFLIDGRTITIEPNNNSN